MQEVVCGRNPQQRSTGELVGLQVARAILQLDGCDHFGVTVPVEVQRYLERLVARLSLVLDDLLMGVYVIGGVAFDEYLPESSDLDVYAVVRTALERDQKLSVANGCSHRMLRCPARRLELVVVSVQAARRGSAAPQWELNLNTGVREPDHVGLDPGAEQSHWFLIDLAIAHERGIALLGPPAHELIAAPQAVYVRSAQAEVVAWYARNELPEDAVTVACRAWHWLENGKFASKREALRWATERLGYGTRGREPAPERYRADVAP
jgi:hypothetical protein